jgi:hypothetical protein
MNKSIATLVLMAAMGTAAAGPSDADMARCANIGARDARLDCFDALALQSSKKVPAVAASPASATPPAIAPAAAPGSAAALAAADPGNFGLTPAQQHTADLGPKMIKANISTLSADQSGRTLVVLDNGQIWSVANNDGWLAQGQAVRIRKASAGSFLLWIPANHSYTVRRIK